MSDLTVGMRRVAHPRRCLACAIYLDGFHCALAAEPRSGLGVYARVPAADNLGLGEVMPVCST